MNTEQDMVSACSDTVELCCRVCLQLEDLMVHIYDGSMVEDLQSDLITLLERCGGIKVQTHDNLPKFLCKECTSELLVAAKFREKCERTQQLLAVTNWQEKAEATQLELKRLSTEHKTLSESKLIENLDSHIEKLARDVIEVDLEELHNESQSLMSTQEGDEIMTTAHEEIYLGLSEENYTKHDTYEETASSLVDTVEKTTVHEEIIYPDLSEETSLNKEDSQEGANVIHFEKAYDDHGTNEETASSIVGPEEKTIKNFKCDSCGAVFMQPTNLQKHLEKVHSISHLFSCENCSYTFSLEASYRKHTQCCTKCTYTSSSSSIATQSTCTYCGKHMRSTFALNMHLRTHTGERPYKCTLCPKAFKTQSACTMHLKRHANNPDHICEICHKCFYEKSNLTAHMRTHTGEKPHTCSLCQKRFSRVFLLQLHMRTHTGEKPYQCATCSRSFAQLCDLKNHERTHTGERRYKCPHCDKAFIKRYAFTAHMERHIMPQQSDEDGAMAKGIESVVKTEEESINYMLDTSMLGGDDYFLTKDDSEDVLCDLTTYEEVTSLGETTNQDLEWSNFIVEEI